jgi:hypothetical protein
MNLKERTKEEKNGKEWEEEIVHLKVDVEVAEDAYRRYCDAFRRMTNYKHKMYEIEQKMDKEKINQDNKIIEENEVLYSHYVFKYIRHITPFNPYRIKQ